MSPSFLDQFERDLSQRIEHLRPAFEQTFGRNTWVFLSLLPSVFHLLRRAALDVEAPLEARRLASVAALYIVESGDFLQEASNETRGLIDDLWGAYAALARVAREIPEARLEALWRSDAYTLEEARALAVNAVALRQHVPSRVLEQLDVLLA